MSSKSLPYEAKLLKLVSKFTDACDEMAALVLQYDVNSLHIENVQELVKKRSAELKNQLNQKKPTTTFSLTPINDVEESKEKDTVSEKAKSSEQVDGKQDLSKQANSALSDNKPGSTSSLAGKDDVKTDGDKSVEPAKSGFSSSGQKPVEPAKPGFSQYNKQQ